MNEKLKHEEGKLNCLIGICIKFFATSSGALQLEPTMKKKRKKFIPKNVQTFNV